MSRDGTTTEEGPSILDESLSVTTMLHQAQQQQQQLPTTQSSTLTPLQLLIPPPTTLRVPSTTSNNSSLTYRNPAPAWQCTFSRDGVWLAVCYGNPQSCIRIYHYQQPYEEEEEEDGMNDGNDAENDSVGTWEYHSTLDDDDSMIVHPRTIRSVAFCPLSKQLILAAASFDASVSIWEFNQKDGWECTTQLEGHDNEVKCVIWNETGSLLATCGRDKTVWIWESFMDGSIGGSSDNDFECIAVLSGHEGDVKCIQFAPSHGRYGDGDEILISAGYDHRVHIWAEDDGDWYCAQTISDLHVDTIWSLTLSPGGCRLISASADQSFAILKAYSSTEVKERFPDWTTTGSSGSNGVWKCVGSLPNAHASTIYSVDYAPAKAGHGRIVSAGADGRIQVYREVMGSTSDHPLFALDAAADLPHSSGDVNCVCWHPWDGSILCSAGDDGSVRIWKFEQ